MKLRLLIFSVGEPGKQLRQFPKDVKRSINTCAILTEQGTERRRYNVVPIVPLEGDSGALVREVVADLQCMYSYCLSGWSSKLKPLARKRNCAQLSINLPHVQYIQRNWMPSSIGEESSDPVKEE